MNLAGNCAITWDNTNGRTGLLAWRLWNAASLSSGWLAEAISRVKAPWKTTSGSYTAFAGMTGRLCYEMRNGAQLPGSAVIVNRFNPGVGDLTISGGATFGASRVLAVPAGGF